MWSPSRPSVFFIGKADGNIDVWDLLDKYVCRCFPLSMILHFRSFVPKFQSFRRLQLNAFLRCFFTLHSNKVFSQIVHIDFLILMIRFLFISTGATNHF